MTFLESLLILLGRICISGFFFWSIYEKTRKWHTTVTHMRAKHVPQPALVLPIAIVIKAIGALMLFFGFYPRAGALLLIGILLPSAIRFHDFWTQQEASERKVEMTLFMKDVAIIGGLLVLLAIGGGRFAFGAP